MKKLTFANAVKCNGNFEKDKNVILMGLGLMTLKEFLALQID